TPVQFATFTIWAGTLPLVLFAPGLLEEISQAPWMATGAVIYLGVFPGAIAYVLWVYAISRSGVSNVASFLYLNPVLAILIAWIWLGEIPVWLSLGGGLVVVLGVALTNVRPRLRMDGHGYDR
ncbi:DMT family transporter, partial [Candidatus Bipolaricaulota bacterium]|nr:DMT family transporter [Candidatus Bipolaricaulota bacterium]